MADTYLDLKTAISDESRRPLSTFGAKIAQCIRDAIIDSEKDTYWFNDGKSQSFLTVANQENYGLAANSIIPFITEFEDLTLVISAGDKRRLKKASWDELQSWNPEGAAKGQPSHYAYAFKEIRLYPIPSDVWTITMAVAYALTDLVADGDSNCWTIDREGGLLVRYRAAAKFYGTHLRLADRASQFEALANGQRNAIIASTSRRQATGRIRGSL